MAQQQSVTANRSDLDRLALAFVVQVQGSWTQDAVDTWRTELKRQGLTPSAAQLEAALSRAREQFETGAAHLFLCTGTPCRQRQKFDASEDALQRVAAGSYPLTTTECQGPCKQAPVATLRVGQRCEMLAQFMREEDWQMVTDFAKRAAAEGTLLISPGEAQPFRFDPVHDHEHTSGPMQALSFLLGHYSGEGVFADGSEGFQKESVGDWQVSGRFLGLRLGVTYPLPDGRKDTHTAFVMLGVNPDTGHLEGRVYTDGGAIHDYHLEMNGDALTFSDRPDAHHNVSATRARKVLQPTDYGFEERLELDRGTGEFELYYRIPMYRTGRE
jgi:hypothetical protein